MCQFFSFVYDPQAKVFKYFDATIRAQIKANADDKVKGKGYEPDSHSSIATFFGYVGAKEDKLDKYEYNPVTMKLELDQNNSGASTLAEAEAFVKALDFKTIIPQLIQKPIVHPFQDRVYDPANLDKTKILLKKWDSVQGSVRGSVGGSVQGSVQGSVGDSVWSSVQGTVQGSVGGSVQGSVWGSVWGPVGGSVWGFVGGYISSFFDLPRDKWLYTEKIVCEGNNPFAPAIELWEMGIVPSFDGTTWRLHAGPKAEIIYQVTAAELRK